MSKAVHLRRLMGACLLSLMVILSGACGGGRGDQKKQDKTDQKKDDQKKQ